MDNARIRFSAYLGICTGDSIASRFSFHLKELTVKKLNKLSLKKVTLRNLDEAELEVIAGGCCPTVSFPRTCLCPTSANDTCAQKKG